MSSIVLDQALERNKSPYFLIWNKERGYSLLQKGPDKIYFLGATHDRDRVLVAYNEYVRLWIKKGSEL